MRTQTFIGVFALLTFVMACTAIGRAFGLKTAEAIYMGVLMLTVALTYVWCRKRG